MARELDCSVNETSLLRKLSIFVGLLKRARCKSINSLLVQRSISSRCPRSISPEQKQGLRKCSRCGYVHGNRPCPANGKTCNKCHRLNHFASVCKGGFRQPQIHGVEEEPSPAENIDEDFHVDIVETDSKPNAWFATLLLEDQEVQLKIDTGAQCNVIPQSIR